MRAQVCDPLRGISPQKELVGDFANGGAEWEPAASPRRVGVHDFPDPEMGKAIPYGVYDIAGNEGWVNVGDHHDTPAFAVASIARWWERMGKARYPDATKLMITADAGGSNGYRSRAFKTELANLAATIGLIITVCHMPPGTSKWNKIEHRLFSFISMNWRGKPLTTYRTVVELIAATTTQTVSPSRPTSTRATTRPGSRSPTPSWRRFRSSRTTSTRTGTTPSSRRLHKAQVIAARALSVAVRRMRLATIPK